MYRSHEHVLRLAGALTLLLLTACGGTQATNSGAEPAPSLAATQMALSATSAPSLPSAVTTSVPSLSSTTAVSTPTLPSAAAVSAPTLPSATTSAGARAIRTAFVIVMENHNWSSIKGSASAPYINTMLLPMASHAEQYYNPPGVHPSEPNYLWLEAGTDFGIKNDADPGKNHQGTTQHLVTLLTDAGISWKTYQENISGTVCPLKSTGLYAPKHNPMVYFDDVTGANDPQSASCIAHERPYTELASDLQRNTVARYNFITPNLCNDMHNSSGCATRDSVKNGDTWLAQAVPTILQSKAYADGGALFITWDEGEGGDGPIGMIVLSPAAKGGGYSNTIRYTHSAMLRTIQEIFQVTPLLGDAAKSPELRDLFKSFP